MEALSTGLPHSRMDLAALVLPQRHSAVVGQAQPSGVLLTGERRYLAAMVAVRLRSLMTWRLGIPASTVSQALPSPKQQLQPAGKVPHYWPKRSQSL